VGEFLILSSICCIGEVSVKEPCAIFLLISGGSQKGSASDAYLILLN
jgi:hypothetical protein